MESRRCRKTGGSKHELREAEVQSAVQRAPECHLPAYRSLRSSWRGGCIGSKPCPDHRVRCRYISPRVRIPTRPPADVFLRNVYAAVLQAQRGLLAFERESQSTLLDLRRLCLDRR